MQIELHCLAGIWVSRSYVHSDFTQARVSSTFWTKEIPRESKATGAIGQWLPYEMERVFLKGASIRLPYEMERVFLKGASIR